jgi:hypothetical protein
MRAKKEDPEFRGPLGVSQAKSGFGRMKLDHRGLRLKMAAAGDFSATFFPASPTIPRFQTTRDLPQPSKVSANKKTSTSDYFRWVDSGSNGRVA